MDIWKKKISKDIENKIRIETQKTIDEVIEDKKLEDKKLESRFDELMGEINIKNSDITKLNEKIKKIEDKNLKDIQYYESKILTLENNNYQELNIYNKEKEALETSNKLKDEENNKIKEKSNDIIKELNEKHNQNENIKKWLKEYEDQLNLKTTDYNTLKNNHDELLKEINLLKKTINDDEDLTKRQ